MFYIKRSEERYTKSQKELQTVSLFVVSRHTVQTKRVFVTDSHSTQSVAVHCSVHEVQLSLYTTLNHQ